MQVLISCNECDFEQWGHGEGELMNKIIMWNHVKREHPVLAARVLRMYQTVPSSIYHKEKVPVRSATVPA